MYLFELNSELLVLIFTGAKGECEKMMFYNEMKVDACVTGECMVACVKKYKGVQFGECVTKTDCLCASEYCV